MPLPSRARAAVAFAAGLLLIAGLVYVAGPSKIATAVAHASPMYLLMGATAYAAFFLLRGIRWRMLLSQSAPDVRLSTTTGTTAVGWLANSILPLKGGEVLRAALLAKRDKVSLVTSAATVALERVLDLLGLAVVAALALLLLPRATELPGWMVTTLHVVWVLPLVAIAMLWVLVRWREQALRVSARVTGRMGRFGEKMHHMFDTVISGLAALAQRPRLVARLLPVTIAISSVQALVFAFLVVAFIPGVTLVTGFAGAAIFLLSFVISVTPGNVGTYEAAFVAVFVALGVPGELAVPASILTHLTTTLIVAIAGGIALAALGLDSRKLAWRPQRVNATQGGLP